MLMSSGHVYYRHGTMMMSSFLNWCNIFGILHLIIEMSLFTLIVMVKMHIYVMWCIINVIWV